MTKVFLLMTLILMLTSYINSAEDSEYASNLFRDRRKCSLADEDECLSTDLNRVPDLKCCRYEVDDVDDKRLVKHEVIFKDYVECSAFFTSYVSETMEKQIMAYLYEYAVYIKAYDHWDFPRMKETLNCSFGSMSFSYGGDDYVKEKDLEFAQNSTNSCLYYYRFSIADYLELEDSPKLSIDQETCENAELFESTKKANVTCNYMEIDIQYEDGTKEKLKTCHLFPSEQLKVKHFGTDIEDSIKDLADKFSRAKNKVYSEYDAKIFIKDGKTIDYNSEIGIVDPEEASDSGYYLNYIYQIILFELLALIF